MNCSQQKIIYNYSIIFTGNTEGLIEHCACKVKRGRILERSYLINKIKDISKETFIFDGGNSISSLQIGRVKLLRLMEFMGYNAYFVTVYDYKELTKFYSEEIGNSTLLFSSFTLLDKNGKRLFHSYIEKNINGKKFIFISITGHTNLPNYYADINLLSLENSLEELKLITKKCDQVFLITDYPEIDDKIKKSKIKKIKYIYHLDKIKKGEMPKAGNNIKILTLPEDGKLFWQIGFGDKPNNEELNLKDVIIGTKIDKELKKYMESIR